MTRWINNFTFSSVRKFSSTTALPKNLITTPIFYVNGSPHIGHLYTAVIADAFNRFNKLLGHKDSSLVTGTDEHGGKVEEAAIAALMKTPDFCDKMSAEYRQLFQHYGIQFSEFIRTTEERHVKAVQHFWVELSKKGYITPGKYSGWYCKADEAFLPAWQVKKLHGSEKFADKDKPVYVSVESGHSVEWAEEENFVFPLGKFMPDVLHWLKNEKAIQPMESHRSTVKWISQIEESETLSISRPCERVNWGIRVPGREDQSIYVWLDALVNYLTVAGYPDMGKVAQSWPPKLQVIGKDIVRFHAVYWPAFLFAAGLEPPERLFVHCHWQVDSEKMSKSRGNVVSPPADASSDLVTMFRYFLLRFGNPKKDTEYNSVKMSRYAQAELGALGNLLNRVTSDIVNPSQEYPGYEKQIFDEIARDSAAELTDALSTLSERIKEHYENCNFYHGLEVLYHTVHLANEFVQREAPWNLVKQPDSHERLRAVIHIALEAVRLCNIALQPIVPHVADTALTKLAIHPQDRTWKDMQSVSWLSENRNKTHKLAIGKVTLFGGKG